MFCHATSVWTNMSHAIFTSLKCDRRHNSALEEAGRLKSQYIDNTITSLFRIRLHINLKIAKHTQTWAASIYISAASDVTSSSAHAGHFRAGYGSHMRLMAVAFKWQCEQQRKKNLISAKNPIWALRPAVWTKSNGNFCWPHETDGVVHTPQIKCAAVVRQETPERERDEMRWIKEEWWKAS